MNCNLNSPCMLCTNRHELCHDTCGIFLDFKTLTKQVNEARTKYKQSISNIARHNRGRCKV